MGPRAVAKVAQVEVSTLLEILGAIYDAFNTVYKLEFQPFLRF